MSEVVWQLSGVRGCSIMLMPSWALVPNKMKQSKNTCRLVYLFQSPRWTAACVSLISTPVLLQ